MRFINFFDFIEWLKRMIMGTHKILYWDKIKKSRKGYFYFIPIVYDFETKEIKGRNRLFTVLLFWLMLVNNLRCKITGYYDKRIILK